MNFIKHRVITFLFLALFSVLSTNAQNGDCTSIPGLGHSPFNNTLIGDTQFVCAGETAFFFITANYSVFVVHSSSSNTLADTLFVSSSPTLNLADIPDGTPNTIYYASAVTGPPLPGYTLDDVLSEADNGVLIFDPLDPCTLISTPIPFVFLNPISITSQRSCIFPLEEYDLTISATGGLPDFYPDSTYSISGDINDQFTGNQGNSSYVLESGENANIIITDDTNCTGSYTNPITNCFDTGDICENAYVIDIIPFAQNGLTTCGFGNEYNDTDACNNDFMNGEDFVFEFTPSETADYNIYLNNASSSVGCFVMDDCPDAIGVNCLSRWTLFYRLNFLSVTLQAGETYYIVVSSYNTTPCTAFDIQIDIAPPSPDGSDIALAFPVCSNDTVHVGPPYDMMTSAPIGTGKNDLSRPDIDNGCFSHAIHKAHWYALEIATDSPPDAELSFIIKSEVAEDYDFALWNATVPNNWGSPVRCSVSNEGNTGTANGDPNRLEIGLLTGELDTSEGATGNGFVSSITVQPGEKYYLLIDRFLGTKGYRISWTGNAVLGGIDEVWPGDTDNNGLVSMSDFLGIGQYYNYTGAACSIEDTIFQGNVCTDWTTHPDSLINNINPKFADANGDGIISEADKQAILNHFELEHDTDCLSAMDNFSPIDTTNGAPLYFNFDSTQTLVENLLYDFPINLGDTSSIAAYGISFTAEFSVEDDAAVWQSLGLSVIAPELKLDNSWLGDETTTLISLDTLVQTELSDSIYRWHIAITRNNQQDTIGYGELCRIACIMAVGSIGKKEAEVILPFKLAINNVNLLLHDGSMQAVNPASMRLNLQTTIETTGNLHCFLEGPYSSTLGKMTSHLRDSLLIPAFQPYNIPPWNYAGTESVPNNAAIPKDVVDWVLIEMRDADNDSIIIEQKAAFLYEDGHIGEVKNDCTQESIQNHLSFCNLYNDVSYHIVIRHRNHIDVMSAEPILITNHEFTYDFTSSETQALGNEQLVAVSPNHYALRVGDFEVDGVITISDFNYYQTQSSMISVYVLSDANLDRFVTISDFNLYQANVGTIGVQQIRY